MRNRLHSICPYFAMFPEAFVARRLRQYSSPGDLVLDPFSGRGTTLLQALLMKRRAVALDVSPVAYCLSAAKAEVPALAEVADRLTILESRVNVMVERDVDEECRALPPFFHRAFHRDVLRQLVALRRLLKWRDDAVDRFIAALTLGALHGEMDKSQSYFSNQMPRTISTKPEYSLRYWEARGLWPPERNVFSILHQRAAFRLHGPVPALRGECRLADVRQASRVYRRERGKVRIVVTSPPYVDVTNYEEDQWLRLWFLGSFPHPTYQQYSRDGRHRGQKSYWRFLAEAWAGIEGLLAADATIICRMGTKKGLNREQMCRAFAATIGEVFPRAEQLCRPRVSRIRNSQACAFRPGAEGCRYEVDFVYRVP